jgi:hypothetical protein
MIEQFLVLLAASLLGAQLIISLVLVKGDICPGQRGRIHKTLPVLCFLWLAVCWQYPYALNIPIILGYFFSQVQTRKTKEQGPLWIFHLTNLFSFAIWMFQVFSNDVIASKLVSLVGLFLLGGILGHCFLTQAKTRLQAFHRLLPIAGVISAILLSLVVLYEMNSIPFQANDKLVVNQFLASFLLLIVGVLTWCLHLLTSRKISLIQLLIACCILNLAVLLNLDNLAY